MLKVDLPDVLIRSANQADAESIPFFLDKRSIK
jgi:hypothetical protein